MAEAFGIACHDLVSLDFRCGSTTEVQREPQNVACWGKSGSRYRAAGCLLVANMRHFGQGWECLKVTLSDRGERVMSRARSRCKSGLVQ